MGVQAKPRSDGIPAEVAAGDRHPHDPAHGTTPAASLRDLARGAAGTAVLVVDDNRDAADSLASALGELGYTVRVAYDPESALLVACDFRAQVALLDIGLPTMDGYQLAERLREVAKGSPPRFIAVTGYGHEADRRRSQAAGFFTHLVKPVDLEHVVAAIAAAASDGPLETGLGVDQ